MNKLSILLVAGSVLAASGIFALLTRPLPHLSSDLSSQTSRMTRQEVPPRTSQRGVASSEEVSTSQPAIESVRNK